MDSVGPHTVSKKVKPGTYYVRVLRWHGDRIYSYTLSSSFKKAVFTKDAELNDIPEMAKNMNVNSIVTGHLGYYSDRKIDDYDYYKVNNLQNGSLTVNYVGTVKPGSYVTLLDESLNNLGNFWIDSYEPASKTFNNLAAGNYYLLAQRWYGDRIYSYLLSTTFETGNEGQPNVVATFPQNFGSMSQDAFKDSLGTPIFALFNKQLDEATIHADTFYVKDAAGNQVVGTPGISGTSVYFVPDFPFEVGQTYTAYLSSNIKDKAGNAIGQDYTWNFTVTETDQPTEITPVSSVYLNQQSVALKVGNQTTMIATVLPENATNKGVQWSSTNPAVATVANGVVQAVGEGTATIIVTTLDGGYTALAQVTVTKDSVITGDFTPWNNGIVSTVSTTKEWKIKFSSPINPATMKENILIVEKGTNQVYDGVDVYVDETHKVVRVAHKDGKTYTSGKTYILYIKKEVQNMDQTQTLKNGYKMEFKVQ